MIDFIVGCIPGIAIALPAMLIFTFNFDHALKQHAREFYLVAIVACIFMYWYAPLTWAESAGGAATPAFAEAFEEWLGSVEGQAVPSLIYHAFFSAQTGIALYIIVMVAGALPTTPRVRRLLAIRSEMSILAGIYIFGHLFSRIGTVIYYAHDDVAAAELPVALETYDIVVYGMGMSLLAVFFLIAWISSFPAIRSRMKAGSWKRLQRATAYPFFGLMCLQGVLVGLDETWTGIAEFSQGVYVVSGQLETFPTWMLAAAGMIWIYLAVGLGYLVLRTSKARADRAKHEEARESAVAYAGAVSKSEE